MSNQSTLLTTLKSSLYNITFKHQQIQFLARRWKTQMQKVIPKGQDSVKQTLVHVVKEGENLSCIAKMYGVPIYEFAAANKDILDLDLVFHGQHLNIPSSISDHIQMTRPDNRQPKFDLSESFRSSDFCNRYLTRQILSFPSSRHLRYQTEDEDQLHLQDVSDSYTELQRDYQKFLSECGMSKRGYWRGGSS